MAEASGSGVPQSNTLSHRKAVLPYSTVGSRWELDSATTICSNSTFVRIVSLWGLLLCAASILFSCATNDALLSDTDFEDGIYSCSYERVTENVQTESLYLNSGMDYSLWQSSVMSGTAVEMSGRKFTQGGFYDDEGRLSGLELSIDADGTIYSEQNESVSGKAYADGRIFWSGVVEEHGQKVFVTEYAYLSRVYETSLAPSKLNGKYKVNLDRRFGELEFTLKNGIAESDVSKFIVDKNGEFRSRNSMKIVQRLGGECQANTMLDVTSYGKIDSDGKVTYKMYAGTSSAIDSADSSNENGTLSFTGEKVALSAEESVSDEGTSDSETSSAEEKPSMQEKSKLQQPNFPSWYKNEVEERNGKLVSCAHASARGKSVAKNIALTTALSKISSHKALSVKSESISKLDGDTRSLMELIEIMSEGKIDYEIEEEYADKESQTYFVKIKEK